MIRKLAIPTFLFLLLFTSTLTFAFCPFCNILQNGGFETGDFTGWTVSGDTTYIGVCDVSTCPGRYAPWDGEFAGYFGPVGDTATISQSIFTAKGKKYTLTFYLANPVAGTPNYFRASFGSVKPTLYILNNSPAFGWTKITMVHQATGPVTPVSFTFRNDPAYWFLDEVAVNGAPPGDEEDEDSLQINAGAAPTLRLGSGLNAIEAGEEHVLIMNVFIGDAPASGAPVTFTSVLGDLQFVSGEVAANGKQSVVSVDDHGQATVRFVAGQPGLSVIEVSCRGTRQRISVSATKVRGQPVTTKTPRQK